MPSPHARPRKPAAASADLKRSFMRDWRKRTRTLERLARRDDLSVDELHELRVATRRLRASIFVVSRCTTMAQAGKIKWELRALGRVLGERRMWDIAIHDAARYGAKTDVLRKKQVAAEKAVRRSLRPGASDGLIGRLQKAGAAIPDMSLERLAPWLEDFEWELAYRLRRRPRTPEERHQLRIQMKKIRYVLECMGRRSRRIEKLQDYLGREHDLGVLRTFVGREPRLTRDAQRARSRANRTLKPALESAMRQLQFLRRDIAR